MEKYVTEQQTKYLQQLRLLEQPLQYKAKGKDWSEIGLSNQIFPEQESLEKFLGVVEYGSEYALIRDKLEVFRKKSQRLYNLGQFLKEYQQEFKELMREKDKIITTISHLQGSTTALMDRQKNIMDLSNSLKQALDYYNYHDKFEFRWPCEVGCRQMFEQNLQGTLSQLMDGIQFFSINNNYTSAKKYLSGYRTNHTKVASFVKSFFIKLLNKEHSFSQKYAFSPKYSCPLNQHFDNLYPKPKTKFLTMMLACFPQFKQLLGNIMMGVKESEKQEQIKALVGLQVQIEQFQLSQCNHLLIAYMQNNLKDIYEEVIIMFLVYYRTALHKKLATVFTPTPQTFVEQFYQNYAIILYLLTCEYAYLLHCSKASSDNIQTIRTAMSKIMMTYSEELLGTLRHEGNCKEPFRIGSKISQLQGEFKVFLINHQKAQYKSYAMGQVFACLDRDEHFQFLEFLANNLSRRIKLELETICFHALPKIALSKDKTTIQNNVRLLIQTVPLLKYCPHAAEKYLITSLNQVVKSIREYNLQIESRYECYAWNLELFAGLKEALQEVEYKMVRKQLRLDMENSENIINKVKSIPKGESLLKYAMSIFNVIRTGMPSINQLSLDFSKFISKHDEQLEEQFLKDMLYIYSKNMIEFLQKIKEYEGKEYEGKDKQALTICNNHTLSALYNGYISSLQKYIQESKRVIALRRGFQVYAKGGQRLTDLAMKVFDSLFDVLNTFYIKTSQYVDIARQFTEIQTLKTNMLSRLHQEINSDGNDS